MKMIFKMMLLTLLLFLFSCNKTKNSNSEVPIKTIFTIIKQETSKYCQNECEIKILKLSKATYLDHYEQDCIRKRVLILGKKRVFDVCKKLRKKNAKKILQWLNKNFEDKLWQINFTFLPIALDGGRVFLIDATTGKIKEIGRR